MDFGVGVSQSGGLETVRALHQTIVALRTALEQSKNEILELKSKAWPIESVQDVIRDLSIENHILRQKIIEHDSSLHGSQVLNSDNEIDELIEEKNIDLVDEHTVEQVLSEKETDKHDTDEEILVQTEEDAQLNVSQTLVTNEPIKTDSTASTKQKNVKKVTIISPPTSFQPTPRQLETRIIIKALKKNNKNSRSLESLTVLKSPLDKKISLSKTISFANLLSIKRELNFNTENTTMTDQEDIEERATGNQYNEEMISPQNDMDQEVDDIELIFTTDETKDQDFKEELVPIDATESNSNLLNLPLSDLDQISDRELDDDVFNEGVDENAQDFQNQSSFELKRENSIFNSRSDNSINHEKSLKSYYSYQDSSFENKSLEKDESFDRFEERVRIVETDISKCGIHEVEYVGGRRNTCPNPIQYRPLSHRDVMSKGINSKRVRPILTHSNAVRRESGAQTDISALPGSAWRSESSLAHKAKLGDHFTTLPSKYPMPGSRLRLSEKTVEARRVLLSDIGFTSMVPELSRSADHLCPGALKPPTVTNYGQFLKATDLYSPGCLSQKFTWTANTATPSESSQTQSRYSSIYPLSPPAPSRRCSVPVSPSRRAVLKSTSSRVRFANGSLPELRTDWITVDSGDSTDSLVDEAENFLRRSIDCIVTNKGSVSYGEIKKTVPRRASAPEPARDNVPPQGWQPFLPRLPRDLKLDNWVKVITLEGRVRGGRVRYIGVVATHGQEQYVGVQLACPEGVSDGVYGGRRYFQCEPYHGIFVPFKKVIMGWRP
ncbi:uncharacterized protein LOC115882596 [Sitophilus oryzae]|uniref:Uncharacterized protein LOC115882596 n=1 Tax=Sitophilus oryzae TaxID=7048 RepID=A0A6J2XYW5_SITOR|nr:uncharacterized protein LOC115882596 [Sitophilus oryzae]